MSPTPADLHDPGELKWDLISSTSSSTIALIEISPREATAMSSIPMPPLPPGEWRGTSGPPTPKALFSHVHVDSL